MLRRGAVGLAIAAVLLTVSCTRHVEGTVVVADTGGAAAAVADAEQCTSVDVGLTTIPAQRDGEPVLRIPVPDDWERSQLMDSDLIRFVIGNPRLVADDFVPNVVVTLERVTGVDGAELAFQQQQQGLQEMLGATEVRVSEHTQCGLPAQTVDYLAPQMGNVGPHPASVLMVVLETNSVMYLVGVTAQTFDPDNPTYRRDVDTVLSGFQVLPPAVG